MPLARRGSRVRLSASSDSTAPERHRRRVIRLQTRCEATTCGWLTPAKSPLHEHAGIAKQLTSSQHIEQPSPTEGARSDSNSAKCSPDACRTRFAWTAGLQRRRQMPTVGVCALWLVKLILLLRYDTAVGEESGCDNISLFSVACWVLYYYITVPWHLSSISTWSYIFTFSDI